MPQFDWNFEDALAAAAGTLSISTLAISHSLKKLSYRFWLTGKFLRVQESLRLFCMEYA
jgi:hypothetical protein